MQGRCPRCLEGPAFKGWLTTHPYCPKCGVKLAREEGYFTGAMVFSYMLAVPIALVVVLILMLGPPAWPFEWAMIAATVVLVVTTPFVVRLSRSMWMHLDRMLDSDPANERYAPERPADPERATRR